MEKHIDSNDSRMQQVYFANGKLWGALDTAVTVGGATKAGIEYSVLNPHSGKLFQQGFVAVAGNNLTYPAIAVDGSGRGIMAFTLVGADHYSAAAYTSMDAKIGAGDVLVVGEGIGPDDGFTGKSKILGAVGLLISRVAPVAAFGLTLPLIALSPRTFAPRDRLLSLVDGPRHPCRRGRSSRSSSPPPPLLRSSVQRCDREPASFYLLDSMRELKRYR